MAMRLKSEYQHMGTQMSEQVGKVLLEGMKNNPKISESVKLIEQNFMEDNTMGNSASLYTTVLAKAIWYKSYDDFEHYFDLVMNLTPEDLGMPSGAGAYKIPKIYGAKAVKLSSGQQVRYTNKNKDDVVLETETYGVGTRINRRLLLRGAYGFVEKLMKAGSDAVLREVCTDIINNIVSGATSGNTIAMGVTYDSIEDAKTKLEDATSPQGIRFGFMGNKIAFSSAGWNIFAKSTDFKSITVARNTSPQFMEAMNRPLVWNDLTVVRTPLVSVQKNSKVVHAVVLDSNHYAAALRETEMETFDGRIPGTPGDQEIIQALDFGMVIMNAEAASVITAA